MSKKVLLTYFESGMGHITAIQSIADSLQKYDGLQLINSYVMHEGNNKKMLDYEKFIIKNTKMTNSLKGYGNMCFHILSLFGLKFFRLLHKTTFRGATNGVLEYFEKVAPDIIVSTHYFMTYCGLEYKKLHPATQVVTYNPDNNVHMWWDNRKDGVFFVNNDLAYEQALKRHFDRKNLFLVPCTTRKCILDSSCDKQYYRRKFGLPEDKFTVIVADGAYAKAKADVVAEYLLDTDRQLSLIFVAGKNKKLYDKYAKECAEAIFKYHRKPDLHCTLESVAPDGTPELWYTAGRVVNPGHDIECSWFVMEEANYENNPDLHRQAVEMFDDAFTAGWDKEYGGLLYFIDCLGKPPEAYEHDMKLWWPHNEILIASMMIYRDTGDEKYLNYFYQTLDYCKEHFADPEFGEWYGYLRRDGKPTMPSTKGSTFKGPFHLPRSLIMVDTMIDQILSK